MLVTALVDGIYDCGHMLFTTLGEGIYDHLIGVFRWTTVSATHITWYACWLQHLVMAYMTMEDINWVEQWCIWVVHCVCYARQRGGMHIACAYGQGVVRSRVMRLEGLYAVGPLRRIHTPPVRMDRGWSIRGLWWKVLQQDRVAPYFDGPPIRYAHHLCVWTGGGPFADYKEGCSIKIGRRPILMGHPIGYAHPLCVWTGGGPFAGYEEGCSNKVGRCPILNTHSSIECQHILIDRPIEYASGLWHVWIACWSTASDMLFSHPIGYALNWISSSVDTLFMGYALHGIHSSCDMLFMWYTLHGIRSSWDTLFMGYALHGIHSSSVWNGCACQPTPSDTLFVGMSHHIHSSWVWNVCVWTHTPWVGTVWMGIRIHTLQ
jgi:hypothetical protein